MPVQAPCLLLNYFTKPEKRHAIIGIRQRDADSVLGSSGTLETAVGLSAHEAKH
jgi:hypothetical protein